MEPLGRRVVASLILLLALSFLALGIYTGQLEELARMVGGVLPLIK